ncbi:hypothetical protein [Pseudophaeobacter leonis]|uniref:hypothetical protein n=1 Tax=Pseudophaeobacter leonis TaxID=1144477 RepID=UPI00111C01E1|nr:hypothetical protein [Pseudophaeobacter leonis]
MKQTRQTTKTAMVLERYAPGLHLELEPDRLGLTLGAFQGQYLYPAACPQAAPERQIAELPSRRIIGAYFSLGAQGIELGLGLRETTAMLSLPADSSYGRRLAFVPSAPEQNKLALMQPAKCMDI